MLAKGSFPMETRRWARPAGVIAMAARRLFPTALSDGPSTVSALSPKLLGRLGASLFVLGGLVSVVGLLAPQPATVNRVAALAVGFCAISVGLTAWVTPWNEHPRLLVSLAPIAVLVVTLGNQYGGIIPFTYAIYFALVFGWIGLALGRGSSILFGPLAAAGYLWPLLAHDQGMDAVGSVITVIPVCVLLGESVAWVAARLRSAEQEVAAREEAVRRAYELDRIANERLHDVERMKDLFLQRISHELRTPLTSILGYAGTLEQAADSIDGPTRREMIRRLDVNARRLEHLLRDLLDLDKLARGAIELQRKKVDIAALVHRVVEELDWGGRNVRVSATTVVAAVDNPIVERMVEHLLLSSIRQAPPLAEILIRVEPTEGGVLLAAEQHTSAIPELAREEMFKPFGERVTSLHDPGLGTDLALVARFAELHGGKAWIENLHEGGNVLSVFLPAGLPTVPIAS
jgi:signal transduction histidine kinase